MNKRKGLSLLWRGHQSVSNKKAVCRKRKPKSMLAELLRCWESDLNTAMGSHWGVQVLMSVQGRESETDSIFLKSAHTLKMIKLRELKRCMSQARKIWQVSTNPYFTNMSHVNQICLKWSTKSQLGTFRQRLYMVASDLLADLPLRSWCWWKRHDHWASVCSTIGFHSYNQFNKAKTAETKISCELSSDWRTPSHISHTVSCQSVQKEGINSV